jgi:hypothetical protein
VEEKNTPHFLDRVGIGLRPMSGMNDILGFDALNMSTPIFDDAVVSGLNGTVAAHGDDRVSLDPFGDWGARTQGSRHFTR